MRVRMLASALFAAALLTASSGVYAHDLKVDSFQVTGTVSAVDADSITVMKGKERFQIARDKDTKTTAEPKVGDKVTVHYKMYAASVESKSAEKAPAKKKK